MERVSGIGGVFFRSKDPKALAQWYQTHLGINLAPTDMKMQPWVSEEGVTVFAPFADDTDYFPSDRMFMLNFRVEDLDAMLAQLRAAGVEITREEAMDGIGRFARIHDPEGNPLELWEPVQQEP
ncbi:MAG: VOC family protein [Pseudomonadota bacterium]